MTIISENKIFTPNSKIDLRNTFTGQIATENKVMICFS